MSRPFRYGRYTLSTTARRENYVGYVLKTAIVALALLCLARQYRHFLFGEAPLPTADTTGGEGS